MAARAATETMGKKSRRCARRRLGGDRLAAEEDPMKRKVLTLLLGLVCALGLTVGLSVSSAGASTRAAADQSWTDPAGDAIGGAPDITAIAINNDAAGTVTVVVTAPVVAETVVGLVLDTNVD